MKRRGFALIELLVLIGIIALILALILPAVQQARDNARKQGCFNKLKQIGLAFHNYHDIFMAFPPGWVSLDGAPRSGPRFGWQAFLLPFMDQAAMYNLLDFNHPPLQADGSPVKLTQAAVVLYRCPQDPAPSLNPIRGNFATSNYSANYGDQPARLAALDLSDVWPGATEAPMRSRGLFARNSHEQIRDVTDGLSNTLLVGERGFASGAAIWVGVTDNAHACDATTDTSHLSRPNAGWSSFSSRHGPGVHILMGDGSARFLSENIESKPGPDLGTYQRLGCKNDGQLLGDF